jgi:predicted metal-binding protein
MKSGQVVPFRDVEKVPGSLIREIREKGKEYGLEDIIPFSTKGIVLAEWVHLKCRYGCNRYDTNWCCPPATPVLAEVQKIIDEYKEALLLVGTQRCPEFYCNERMKRTKQVRYWKGVVSLERLLFLKGYYKAFSLVGVTCALCKNCAYPEKCLFPQEKRPTVESFSIDVIGTLNHIGIPSQVVHKRTDSFNYYSIILLH